MANIGLTSEPANAVLSHQSSKRLAHVIAREEVESMNDPMDVGMYLVSAVRSASGARSATTDPAIASLATAIEFIARARFRREGLDVA